MKAITGALVWHEGSFHDGLYVGVEGDQIASISSEPPAPVDDWGDVAIVPGTVNAHGHSFQSLFKGYADDRTFESWRDEVLYPFSERLDGHAIYTGALLAFAEALLAGVTTTVDFFYLHDGSNDNAGQVVRAAHDLGIRLVLARTFYDLDAPTKAPGRFRERSADSAERCMELARELRDDPLVQVQPAPHSLHAASPETIGQALEVAAKLGVPCHLHLAEAPYEVELIEARFGTTPVRLLYREGLLDRRLVTVHTVWVDDEELDMIAAAGAGVVHCPGANAFLGDGVARLPEMLERGIRVALGPDGGCANNRQSVFDEMRQASLLAKARLTDGGALDAHTAFSLGTAAGGDMLMLPVGRIAPGNHADLVALDLADLSLQPTAMLDRHIVNSMQATAVRRVMTGGEVVVDGGRLVRMDNRRLRELLDGVTRQWSRP